MRPAIREPLILAPGLLCNHRLWRHQLDALSDIARPTVAMVERDDNLPAMARRLLRDAPPRFALAGLSLGGYLCFEVMRQAPRRVTRLALLDTSPEADTRERALVRDTLMELARRQRFESVLRTVVPGMLGRTAVPQALLQKEIEAMAREVGAEAFQRQQSASLQRPDSRAELTHYRLPCLILCGAEDTLTPPELHQNMAAQIPGAALRVVQGCGHLPPLEQPADVNAALRSWLQQPR